MTQYDFELYDNYSETLDNLRANIKERISRARGRRMKRLIRRELRLEGKIRKLVERQLEMYSAWLKKEAGKEKK